MSGTYLTDKKEKSVWRMYLLETLLERVDKIKIQGSEKREISAVVQNSKKIVPGALFVCIRGVDEDGHCYISEAVKKGAAAVLTEEWVQVEDGVTQILVGNTRKALAQIAAVWFQDPVRTLHMIGVTGTKGKTTTAWIIWRMLVEAGYPAALIGTIQVCFGKKKIRTKNTTPDAWQLQELFAQMRKCGCTHVVMEVSSQALKQFRTYGILFETAVFTNLAPDHIGIGEHKDFSEYLHCKSLLFRQCRLGILNRDDAHWQDMLCGSSCKVRTFGLGMQADYYGKDVALTRASDMLGICYQLHGRKSFPVQMAMPGIFNVYNSLAAIAVGDYFQVPEEIMKKVLKTVQVPGRTQLIKVSDRSVVLVDYAHNAMALERLLATLMEYRPGHLICLFGCGGNRSRDRRFQMGEISGELADLTIITSDNPRFEEPMQIIRDIRAGVQKTRGHFLEIPDRRSAIAKALQLLKPGDILVVAGKGHEDYQEIRGKRYPMDDRTMIRELYREQKKNEKDGR